MRARVEDGDGDGDANARGVKVRVVRVRVRGAGKTTIWTMLHDALNHTDANAKG